MEKAWIVGSFTALGSTSAICTALKEKDKPARNSECISHIFYTFFANGEPVFSLAGVARKRDSTRSTRENGGL